MLVLLTENFILLLFIISFTPSFLSTDTVVTVSIESIKSFDETIKVLSFSVGTTSNATAFTAANNAKALGRSSQSSAALGLMANVGASDMKIVGVFTGTDGDGTTGAITTTVAYSQDNSLQRTFTIV